MMVWRDVVVESERRHDEMVRAREARLIRQFASKASRSPNRYQRWVHSLGGRLVRWGAHLQACQPARTVEAEGWRLFYS